MSEPNLAEAIDFENQEQDKQPDKQDPKKQVDHFDERKLSPNEVRGLRERRLTLPQIIRERKQLKADAEALLKDFSTGTKEKSPLVTLKEYRDFKRQLEDTESAEKTKEILERLHDLPDQKQEAAQQEKDEKIELEPNDPKLLELENKFNKICDDNAILIGEKQIPGFKAWFTSERQKTPTIQHLKLQIARLEGRELKDRDGLAPRRAEYARLEALFKKYGLQSPQECDWIRLEGLSERQTFRKKIEEIEKHFDTVKDTGFYSREMIQTRMRENLITENPTALDARLKQAKDIARKESEGYTYLDGRMEIAGVTIRKMSEASKQKYLEYYRNTDFKEREKLVDKWRELVENETKLAKELEGIYGEDKEGLKLALGSFAELDFLKKEAALKTHKRLVEESQSKEERDRTLVIEAAHAQLEKAAGKNIISGKTLEKYKAFFENEDNFKNPETHEPGDVKGLKKAYEMLISSSPNEKYKNLAAYEARKKAFRKDIDKLQEINPNISDEEITDWQDKYDKEGWSKRETIHKQELINKIAKERADLIRRRELEKKAGMQEKEKDEKTEKAPKLNETIKAVTELLGNDQGAEAMRLLLEYNETNPDNPKVLFWMQTTANYMREFGSGKKREQTVEKELEKELEEMARSDEGLQDEILEQQIKTLNIQGAKQSEQRHSKNKSAHERAKDESLGKTPDGSLEADLTEDAYAQLGEEYILDKEGKAEEIQAVYFDETGMDEKDLLKLKRKTYQDQSKLDTREGFMREIEDKSGKIITTEAAESIQEEELEGLESEMADQAQQNVEERMANGTEGAKIFDLNAKIAARRKAKQVIDRKRYEKLRTA